MTACRGATRGCCPASEATAPIGYPWERMSTGRASSVNSSRIRSDRDTTNYGVEVIERGEAGSREHIWYTTQELQRKQNSAHRTAVASNQGPQLPDTTVPIRSRSDPFLIPFSQDMSLT